MANKKGQGERARDDSEREKDEMDGALVEKEAKRAKERQRQRRSGWVLVERDTQKRDT